MTLTRYVRVDRADHRPRLHKPRLPGLELGFVQEGRTKFPTRVMRVDQMNTLLVSGHSNVKIGRDVRKGRLRGYWIYTLSLEERKTCPRTCAHWQSCYGNNMMFAKRIDHTDPKFLLALEKNVAAVVGVRGRRGVLVRLHALGDFYSEAYVGFWRRMLQKHPTLSLFGYTAWRHDTAIGAAVKMLVDTFGDRAMIRVSDGGYPTMSTVPVVDPTSVPAGAFMCPEQSGKTRCCATCGACWSTERNVAFAAH